MMQTQRPISPDVTRISQPRLRTRLVSRSLVVTAAVAFVATLATAYPTAAAETASATTLTRAAAISAAAEHNPGLDALSFRVDAAEHDADARYRQHFGTLDAIASYSLLSDEQILRPMAKDMLAGGMGALPFDRNQFHYGLRYRVPLYLGGKLYAAVDIARIEAEKATVILQGTRWTVRFNATALYVGAQSLDAAAHALDEQIAALVHTEERLALMVRAGKRPDIDRLKVVESLGEAKARRAEIAGRRARTVALLSALMGRSPRRERAEGSAVAALRLEPISEVLPELTADRATLADALEETTPIRSAQLAVEQAGHAVRLATSAFIPRVAASAEWLQHAGPSAGDPLNTWAIGIQVDVPLLEGGSRFAARDAAEARQAAAQAALEQIRLQREADLEDALASFKAAREQVTAALARQVAAREAARIEQVRYDTGAGTIEDLVLARAHEEGAEAGLAQARVRVVVAGEQINRVLEQEVVR